MITTLRRKPRSSRTGFSLIELLVVISIISTLMALVLPAIHSVRQSARQMQCLSNMREVGIAIQNYASGKNGELPAITDKQGYNWPVSLLAYLNHSDLAGLPVFYGNENNAKSLPVKVLTCPLDTNNFGKPWGLSYAANAGYGMFHEGTEEAWNTSGTFRCHGWMDVDWNLDGTLDYLDADIARDAGVMFRRYYNGKDFTTFAPNLGRIGQADGTSSTLLLAENTNSMNWGYSDTDPDSNAITDTMFVVNAFRQVQATVTRRRRSRRKWRIVVPPTSVCEVPLGVDGADPNFTGSPLEFAINPVLTDSRINSSIGGQQGEDPSPSSYHGQFVNVIFCDGHATNLSESIAPDVYLRLISSGGTRHGQQVPLAPITQ